MKELIIVAIASGIALSVNAQGLSDKKDHKQEELGTYSLFLENNRTEAFRLFQDSDEAQRDTTWKFGGLVGLNFNQAAFINWAAGGQNSISYSVLGNVFARYAKGKTHWITTLDLAYGQTRLGDGPMRKTDDRIELNSKYGYKISEEVFWSALLNFRTQFDEGFNFPNDSVSISEFMSPGYLTFALGLDYIPNESFSLMVSPLASKMTFVMNQRFADAGQFGVTAAEFDQFGNRVAPGENFRYEFGASLTAMYKTRFAEDKIGFSTRLQLFTNYLEDPDHIDINWEGLLSFKINDYLNASISTLLIYDHDITITEEVDGEIQAGPRTQFKEVLSIGFAYTIK